MMDKNEQYKRQKWELLKILRWLRYHTINKYTNKCFNTFVNTEEHKINGT
jgi:hypothetical protein